MQSTTVQSGVYAAQEALRLDVETGRQSRQSATITDPFLQIILGLLTASPEQATQQQDGTLRQTLPELSDEQAAVLMSELAALQLVPFGFSPDAPGESTPQPAQTTALISPAALGLSLDGAGAQAPLIAAALAQADNAMPLSLETPVGKTGFSANLAQPPAQATALPADEALPQITLLRADAPPDGAQAGQDTLSEAVSKAKQLLAPTSSQKAADTSDLDVDGLQNTLAKADTVQPFALRFKPVVNATTEAPLADQLLDGLRHNLSSGKSTFVVKLNPAELGEITVKLVEEAGKTTLTLAAANAHTAKLLNQDLAALREAVAPMNIEVREAVVSTNETAGGSMQQFNLAGQQFAQQQFAGSQSFYTAARGQTVVQAADESYETAQPLTALRYSTNRLDAYV